MARTQGRGALRRRLTLLGATVRQCVFTGPNPDAALLRELVRFGVEEAVVPQASPPWPTLPRNLRFVGAAEAPAPLDPRYLRCEPHARLDFNLARLLAAPSPCVAIRAGEDAGIQVLRRDGGTPRPIDVAPLPAHTPRPALFLDRDGTINVDHGYVGTRNRFEWLPGALAAIRLATDAGWHVFVVTNQSGIARGLYDEAALACLHRWMTDEIRAAGGNLDDLLYCPFHEAAVVPRYRRASGWRKPAPGMILDLMQRWSLDPASCLMVGDQETDMQAAAAAGIAGRRLGPAKLADIVADAVAGKINPSS